MKILPDKDNWRKFYLDQDYSFYFEGHTFTIRRGYRFDGHSVPWIARTVFAPDTNLPAALVHDYIIDTMPWHRFGYRFAARAYLQVMRNDTWLRRNFMPAAVTAWAYIKTCIRGDYRGKIKPNTVVDVRVII
jgi:hypothetical protein